MRALWLIGIGAVGSAALGFPGGPPAGQPTVPDPPAEGRKLPDELTALNTTARAMYAGARAREVAAVPVVIHVAGDDLVLRKNGTRTVATVTPAEYHALKCVAHTTLALFGHLSEGPGQPLGPDRLNRLKEFQRQVAAAGPAVERCGFDPDTLARQKRLLARTAALTAQALQDGRVSADDLTRFCRAARADVTANGAAAVRAQLRAIHAQVMAWKQGMTAAEWSGLTVVVSGSQPARAENAAVQYFARLFGEGAGEGRRVVYAEGVWDEEKAVSLVGTLRLDGKLAEAVFGDRFRLYRDFLADGARAAIDDLLAPE